MSNWFLPEMFEIDLTGIQTCLPALLHDCKEYPQGIYLVSGISARGIFQYFYEFTFQECENLKRET